MEDCADACMDLVHHQFADRPSPTSSRSVAVIKWPMSGFVAVHSPVGGCPAGHRQMSRQNCSFPWGRGSAPPWLLGPTRVNDPWTAARSVLPFYTAHAVTLVPDIRPDNSSVCRARSVVTETVDCLSVCLCHVDKRASGDCWRRARVHYTVQHDRTSALRPGINTPCQHTITYSEQPPLTVAYLLTEFYI